MKIAYHCVVVWYQYVSGQWFIASPMWCCQVSPARDRWRARVMFTLPLAYNGDAANAQTNREMSKTKPDCSLKPVTVTLGTRRRNSRWPRCCPLLGNKQYKYRQRPGNKQHKRATGKNTFTNGGVAPQCSFSWPTENTLNTRYLDKKARMIGCMQCSPSKWVWPFGINSIGNY